MAQNRFGGKGKTKLQAQYSSRKTKRASDKQDDPLEIIP